MLGSRLSIVNSECTRTWYVAARSGCSAQKSHLRVFIATCLIHVIAQVWSGVRCFEVVLLIDGKWPLQRRKPVVVECVSLLAANNRVTDLAQGYHPVKGWSGHKRVTISTRSVPRVCSFSPLGNSMTDFDDGVRSRGTSC